MKQSEGTPFEADASETSQNGASVNNVKYCDIFIVKHLIGYAYSRSLVIYSVSRPSVEDQSSQTLINIREFHDGQDEPIYDETGFQNVPLRALPPLPELV